MKTNIKGEKLELTQSIEDYLQKKIDSLEKFLNVDDDSLIAYAIAGKTTTHHAKGNYFRAEIKIKTPRKDFFARVEKDDLYAAIDEAKDILKRDIIKYKETFVDKNQQG
ncbi:MAG: ribosome-associated translation inhibitor RaiA [bacterium]